MTTLVTRQLLSENGASKYLAEKLTKGLTVVQRIGRAFGYSAESIWHSAKNMLLDNHRLKASTKIALRKIITYLEKFIALRLNDVLEQYYQPIDWDVEKIRLDRLTDRTCELVHSIYTIPDEFEGITEAEIIEFIDAY
jgi:hypothetical protein